MSSSASHIEKQDLSLQKESTPESFGAADDGKSLTFIEKLARSLNAETKGVDIVTDEEKTDNSIMNAATMWFSANLVLSGFSLGSLGTAIFGLNFMQSTLVIIFFSILGVLPVAFFSLFGIRFGLRQMILTRFLMGNIAARIFAAINVVALLGWGAVNTMVSAQLLHIVNPGGHQCPPWAGCLIIVVTTIIVTFFGYRVIHVYEKWCWIPNLIMFLIILGRLAKTGNFVNEPAVGGPTTAGGVLSFGGAIFGFAAGWTTYASDYTAYMPKNTNKVKVFVALVAGMLIPIYFCQILGAAAITGIKSSPLWNEYYNKYSIGGLVYVILVEDHGLGGFGQFCCVMLAMSTVANNVPNMYSIALSFQALSSKLTHIPRPILTVIGNFAVLAIAIPAYYKFEEFLSNFMNIVAYYLSIYIAMALSEHFFYRKGFSGYAPEEWNNHKYLSIGYSGLFGFLCGVAGVVVGMDQVWYDGPIGRLIGEVGGDIGFELGGAFSFIAYNATRWLEIKYTGR